MGKIRERPCRVTVRCGEGDRHIRCRKKQVEVRLPRQDRRKPLMLSGRQAGGSAKAKGVRNKGLRLDLAEEENVFVRDGQVKFAVGMSTPE